MKVHHLNCGSMHPPGTPTIVCHVLAVEGPHGLVLVDTGFGTADVTTPGRIGPARHLLRPAFDPAETAAAQLRGLGFEPSDVRDIVITHFDIDHIGGLADFPQARVHTTSAEVLGAITAPTRRERARYSGAQWAHGPHLVQHTPDGDRWRGFAAAKVLDDIADGVVLLALPGHSRGHAAVAIDAGERWLVQAGDAFYHHAQIGPADAPAPRLLTAMESMVAWNRSMVRDNHERLTELAGRGEPDLLVVNAHDETLLQRAKAFTAAAD